MFNSVTLLRVETIDIKHICGTLLSEMSIRRESSDSGADRK